MRVILYQIFYVLLAAEAAAAIAIATAVATAATVVIAVALLFFFRTSLSLSLFLHHLSSVYCQYIARALRTCSICSTL